MNKHVVIIGGGWAGCAAAIAAANCGADVSLIEKTDLLLGLGNVGGIMRNNGRFCAAEENIALGMGEIFEITDRLSLHKNIDFPGHSHASLYDVFRVEPAIRRLIKEKKIEVFLMARAVDADYEKNESGERIVKSIILADGRVLQGDAFVECTGSTGPMGNCLTYGNGCSMCILRCPSFGPRVSITKKIGLDDVMGQRSDGAFGAFSGSCKLEKSSLSEEIRWELDSKGVVVVSLTDEQINREKLDMKVCQQYALDEYAENLILLDTGYAKLMTPFFPLEKLREISGFENARYADPYAGGKTNSIRYLSVTSRGDDMRVKGTKNMFCGGEKSGLFVGHTEAISTGSLSGCNACRFLKGMPLLELPQGTAIGDLISYAGRQMELEEGLKTRYTFAGSDYFKRMKEKGLYTLDRDTIAKRIEQFGLKDIYKQKIL